jgi:intein-encoded DNA endonuclease-like protein
MSYGRIQERISADSGCFVSKGTISEWLRGIHKPLGSVNEFDQTASFELAYVIGVVLSDGNINARKYDREILLSVTDREYAEEFRRCLEESLVDLLTPKLDEVTRGTGGLFRNAASCYTSF